MKRTRFFALAAGLALAAALAPSRAGAADFTVSLAGVANTISWPAQVDPSSATAPVTYYLLYKFGKFSQSSVLTTGTTIYTGPSTSLTYGSHMAGTFCVVARSSSPVSGVFNESPLACHAWLHKTGGGGDEGITRVDGNGTQLGFNQQWYFKYYLDEDSLVTLNIYPPGTTLTTDTSGFSTVNGSPTPTKVIVSSNPRSGELDGTVQNQEMWDSRNSAGQVVNNGLYIGQFIITNPLYTQTTRYIGVFTVPVDVIRFTAFNTVGISPTQSMAQINYTITGDATVRIVIAKQGRQFGFAGNGDVVPLCPAGATWTCVAATGLAGSDVSTYSVVQVLTYNKRAGSYSEGWNGTDWAGVAVDSAIYSVGLSAKDAYGNQAMNLSGGNNGPVQGTIPVERTASQAATDTTPPSVTAVTVGGQSIALAGGSSVNAGFTSIVFTLNKPGGTAGNSSVVTLTGPSGAVAGGSVATSSNVVTYSTATSQNSTGTYTVTIVARDTLGNTSSANSYTFAASTDTVVPAVGYIQVNGSSISLTGTTSIDPGFTTIAVGLSKQSGTGVFVSTVTLAGPGGAVAGALSISSNVLTFTCTATQITTGTYTVTVTARDSNGNTTAALPYTFTMAAANNPGGQTVDQFKSTLKLYPNPVRTAPLNIEFSLGANATVDFDIFNILGERCFHQSGSYTAGVQTLTWNLANDSAKIVGNGVYLFRIMVNDGRQTFKIVKKVMVLR